MEKERLNLYQYVDLIDEPNRTACRKLLKDNFEIITAAQGSKTKHQAWSGGYVDHLEEMMNFGFDLYDLMTKQRPLPFSRSDFLLVTFLHDIEKPFKYKGGRNNLDTEKQKECFLYSEIIPNYGFVLTDDHRNALKYAHGEGEDYHPTLLIQKPLGAFLHMADVASARIWYGYPQLERTK